MTYRLAIGLSRSFSSLSGRLSPSLVRVAPRSVSSLGSFSCRWMAESSFLPRADVEERVLEVVKKFPKIDPEKVHTKAHFIQDLGLDSLDTVEMVMAFEDEFTIEISDEDSEKIFTPEDAISYIVSHPMAK